MGSGQWAVAVGCGMMGRMKRVRMGWIDRWLWRAGWSYVVIVPLLLLWQYFFDDPGGTVDVLEMLGMVLMVVVLLFRLRGDAKAGVGGRNKDACAAG